MEVTIENLERAVSQFYHTDSVLQAQAHQWLTAAQSSIDAWAFVWQLLQPTRSAEVQFFAATTLHNKIMRDWKEVPADQYGSLKEKLLEHVIQYSTGPKIVLNRLCIALSAYLIQTTPYFWQDSLTDLMSFLTPARFTNIPPERIIWILLEIFSVIPEEFDTMTLSQKHKSLIRNDLEKVSNQVVNMVEGVLGCGAGQEVENQAAKTAVSWLRFGVPLPSGLPLARKLVHFLQQNIALDQTESGEMELEALYQMATHPDTHQFPTGVLNLLEIVLPLASLTQTHADNMDLVMNIYRVLVGLAESHTSVLLKCLCKEDNNKVLVQELIRVILRCTQGPGQYPTDETHSQLTLSFWYILQDDLVNLSVIDVDIAKRTIIPAYKEVTTILLDKSQYPSDGVQFSAQDSETFRCYRQDISDTMVYCYYVVRQFLVEELSKRLHNATSWQQAEAVYHVILALAETSSDEEDTRILELLSIPPPLHMTNATLLNTLNQAIGGYSEWLSCRSEALGSLIPRLVKSLENQETATSATMALKDITRECSVSLKPYVEPLYTSCQDAVLKGILKYNECNRLMYAMGKLLSIMQYEAMVVNLNHLLNSHISSIEEILSSEEKEKQNNQMALLGRLRMISQLLMTLYTDEVTAQPPALIALNRLLPVLANVTQSSAQHSHIIEEVCNNLRNGVLSLMEKCESLLAPIANIIYTCYSVQPNTPALELVRNVVLLFGANKESESSRVVLVLLHSIVDKTLNLNSLDEHMDTLQAFLVVLSNIVKKQPILFAETVDPNRIFNFSIGCLMMSEQCVVKVAGTFISNVVGQARENPSLHSAVHNNGQLLVTTCLTCIGTDIAQRWVLEILGEILLVLNKKFSDDLSRWLSTALSQNDFPSPRATAQLKANFSSSVIKERANRRKLHETITEFSLICRGLVTTDFNYQHPQYTE